MKDRNKTKEQLIQELEGMRHPITKLEAGGNQTIAAQMLGLTRRALNNRLRRSHQ